MNRNFYFDMDGVLASYGEKDYIGENPVWLKKNIHYFYNREPDWKALKIADEVWRYCQRYHKDKFYVLTSLKPMGAIFNEHFHDKLLWLQRYMPYLKIENILISVTDKRDAVEYITGHCLTKEDILIDDYNKNLTEWEHAGGTAIKYCNCINNPASWSGLKILPDMTAAAAVDTLVTL